MSFKLAEMDPCTSVLLLKSRIFIIIIIIIIIISFTARIDSETHNGDEIDDRTLADRLLL